MQHPWQPSWQAYLWRITIDRIALPGNSFYLCVSGFHIPIGKSGAKA